MGDKCVMSGLQVAYKWVTSQLKLGYKRVASGRVAESWEPQNQVPLISAHFYTSTPPHQYSAADLMYSTVPSTPP